jgi:oleandomycin transport system permease protein
VTSVAGTPAPAPATPAAGPGPVSRPGPRRTVREATLICGRQLAILRANPSRLLYPLIQPVVLLVLFLAIFAGLARVPGATYRQYLVPGIIVQNVALTAPTVGLGLVLDAVSGITDRFRSLPMARSAVLLGRMLAESLIFFVQALLVLGVASLLGFRVRTGLPGMAGIVAVAVAFGVALGITMCWLALRINDPDTAGRALFLPMVPLTFISSTFTPIDRLAGWLQPLARANPVTAAVNVIRSLADGGPLGREPLYLAVWLVILSVAPGLLAVRRWQSG